MNFETVLQGLNYCLVLLFGLLLSAMISGSWKNRQEKILIMVLCPVFLAAQGIFWLLWGVDRVTKLYPLIIHIPIVLILIFALKRKLGIAFVSVCTAYLCCQLPRWINLMLTALTGSALIGEIGYTLLIVPIFYLLQRFLVRPAYETMTHSVPSLILFGSLPFAYYVFDYATTVYSDVLYADSYMFQEFLPTILIIFYLIFITAYHVQEQKRIDSEFRRSILEKELKQSSVEIEGLRRSETQTAIYQHDMRHHLLMVDGFLSAGNSEKAQDYIEKILTDVSSITPRRYCQNETVNLLCSSFQKRAEGLGISLTIQAQLPNQLPMPETAFCAVLSNGLDNALHGASGLDAGQKWVELFCGIRMNKLLIEIKNPYSGTVTMSNEIPVSSQEGHGYGCKSIRAITETHHGICMFEPKDGIFTLRVMIPVQESVPI